MRYLRPLTALMAVVAVTAACSTPGTSSSSQASSAAQSSQDAGASQPAASVGGGGGNGGIFGNGSAKYHITGDYTADGELGFVPAASQFDQNGTSSLSFTDDASNTVLIIVLSADTQVLSYGDSEHSIPGATCDFSMTRQDANGAAGTFKCDNQAMFTSAGSTSGTASISGEFDARK